MRILISAIHWAVASGRYYARAFRRLGHDVRTAGPEMGNTIWGIKVKPEWAWAKDAPPEGWRPDLYIHCDSEFIDIGPIHGCPKVLIGVDNHVRKYDWPSITWDARFLCHSWGAGMSEPNTYWLPAGYDPDAHYDLGLARDQDVGICAVPYENRMILIDALSAAGLNAIGMWGQLWDEYNIFYNRTKIALVKSLGGDVPMRVFENMAQGCCVLTDRQRDLDKLGFTAGVDYWPYDDAESAAREARYLIETGRYAIVAETGKAKLTAGRHRWDDRAMTVLDIMGMSQ